MGWREEAGEEGVGQGGTGGVCRGGTGAPSSPGLGRGSCEKGSRLFPTPSKTRNSAAAR